MASGPCEGCKNPEKTIDDCYNQVIERLTAKGKIKEVSSHLLTLETNHEKVLYVYSILKELAFLPIVRTNPKDNKVSVYYRCQGNEHFKHKRNYEAWQCYNLSLLYAVTSSENFIYAVSNRSAVFFAMGKYEECLEDIKFVFSSEFPEKIRDKLIDRRQQCQSKLAVIKSEHKQNDNDKEIAEILRLKGPRDKKYINASSKLKVIHTREMGRHVVANEDIEVGEVLVEEVAYLTVLLEPQYLFSCAYCLSRKMNLYPCMTCTYTLYCSVECREAAHKKYHVVECGLLPSILGMEFSKMDLLAFRTLMRSRTDREGWYEMFKVAQEAESRVDTDLWGCVKVDNEWIYDSQHYTAIHTLATNLEKRPLSDLFKKSLNAAVLTHFLSVLHFLKSNDEDMAIRANRYVSGTLLLHIMTGPTNMHDISTNIQNAEGKYVDEYHIASGAYPFLSLLNHSCAPNVVRCSKLGTAKMALVAIRPIRKGMQIFDNYGYHYAVQDRETRQSSLNFQYKFTCACEACVDDWPLYAVLKEAKGLPPAVLKKKEQCLDGEVIEKLMKGDQETALKFYKPLCEIIEALVPFAPCKELADCQEALKQCLAIFHGVVPYGYSKLVPWKAFPPCESTGGPPHFAGYISGPAI